MADTKDLRSLSAEATLLSTTLWRHSRTLEEYRPIYLQSALAGFVVLQLVCLGLLLRSEIYVSIFYALGLIVSLVACFRIIRPLNASTHIVELTKTQLQETLIAAEKVASSGYVIADKVAGGAPTAEVQAIRELGIAIQEGYRRLKT